MNSDTLSSENIVGKKKELSSEKQKETIMVSFKTVRWDLSTASEHVRLDASLRFKKRSDPDGRLAECRIS
jgi:hypothetical protein